jgi:hypothetical protein
MVILKLGMKGGLGGQTGDYIVSTQKKFSNILWQIFAS